MKKIGMVLMTAAFATTSALAQMSAQSNAQMNAQTNAQTTAQTNAQTNDQGEARKSGNQGSPGVVTGQNADGGIALQSDAKKTQGTVPSVSGGVSLNARDTLRGSESNANVKLVFALNTGNYVSDVQVKVVNSAGKVIIEDTSNGPWLLARLPAGSYTATATYNGKAVTQKFSVAKSGLRTAQFRWPASVENQAVGSAAVDAGGSILGTGPQEPQR